MGLKIAELDHVVLRCRDQARALDFYTRILGLKEERRVDRIGLIQLRAGTSMLDLVPASDPRIESGLNVDHFCLGIEAADLNETVRYLRENSVEVLGEPAARYGARGMGTSILRTRYGGQRRRTQTDAYSRVLKGPKNLMTRLSHDEAAYCNLLIHQFVV